MTAKIISMVTIWLICTVAGVISSNKHENLLKEYPDKYDRVGIWERMWYGATVLALYEIINLI